MATPPAGPASNHKQQANLSYPFPPRPPPPTANEANEMK